MTTGYANMGFSGDYGMTWHLVRTVGAGKAKELLFTADSINADEARDLGMVNTVVPADQLDVYCSEMAAKITAKPMFALQMAKEAVNQQQDAMGRKQGRDAVFSLHHLCHAYAVQQFGIPIDPRGSFTPTKKRLLEDTPIDPSRKAPGNGH